jgi:hypothetical protein
MNHRTIANSGDVRIDGIKLLELDGCPCLEIRGLLFHSALAVETVEVHSKQKVQQVLISMTAARAGLSGAFKVDVPVPGNVDQVVLGHDTTPLWIRTRDTMELPQ